MITHEQLNELGLGVFNVDTEYHGELSIGNCRISYIEDTDEEFTNKHLGLKITGGLSLLNLNADQLKQLIELLRVANNGNV